VTGSINIPLDHEDADVVLSLLQKLHVAAQVREQHRARAAARGARPKLPAVECAPWCDTGDGHPDCFGASDQACWSVSEYVGLSLPEYRDMHPHTPRVGVMARREPGTEGAVRVHLDEIRIRGPIPSPWDVLDENVDLTPSEARALGTALLREAARLAGTG
jgi:hypothetical protein